MSLHSIDLLCKRKKYFGMRMIKKINSFFSPVDSAELFLVRSEVTIDVGLNKDEDTGEGNQKVPYACHLIASFCVVT